VFSESSWAAPFEVNKLYDDPTPWQHVSALAFTDDAGRTWPATVDVHTDPARRMICWDQRVSKMPDASLLALFWTYDRQKNAYLNIHASRSTDRGRTWAQVYDTGVPGQPARAAGLSNGDIVMTYVDRTAAPVIKVRRSGDGGRTWSDALELPTQRQTSADYSGTRHKSSMPEAWSEMAAFSLGLPDAVPLANGDVLIVYYSGPHADQTDIEWARVRV
jgi:hypothetical protein